MTKQEQYNLRDMLDGLLNRIMITDDMDELNKLVIPAMSDVLTLYYERRAHLTMKMI